MNTRITHIAYAWKIPVACGDSREEAYRAAAAAGMSHCAVEAMASESLEARMALATIREYPQDSEAGLLRKIMAFAFVEHEIWDYYIEEWPDDEVFDWLERCAVRLAELDDPRQAPLPLDEVA